MSFPRYERYKDSGVEWLGDVPEHWEVRRLKIVAAVSPSNVDKKEYVGEVPVRLCNYTDVYYNDVITADMPFMSATASTDQVMKFTLRADDTILTKDSETADDIAASAYVPADLPGVVCGYHLSIARAKPGVSGAFLKFIFDSHAVRAQAEISCNGLTRVGLSKAAIDNLLVPVPPLAEQEQIVRLIRHQLFNIDALIEEQRTLIVLLKEKRQAAISHAVTKGLNRTTPMRDSGFAWMGRVPLAWPITKLGRVAYIQEGPGLRHWQFSIDGIRVICVTNITASGIDFSLMEKFISTVEYQAAYRHFTVNHGDILLSSSGNSGGKVSIYLGLVLTCINPSKAFWGRSGGLPPLSTRTEWRLCYTH